VSLTTFSLTISLVADGDMMICSDFAKGRRETEKAVIWKMKELNTLEQLSSQWAYA
jgi:hypothetical protein